MYVYLYIISLSLKVYLDILALASLSGLEEWESWAWKNIYYISVVSYETASIVQHHGRTLTTVKSPVCRANWMMHCLPFGSCRLQQVLRLGPLRLQSVGDHHHPAVFQHQPPLAQELMFPSCCFGSMLPFISQHEFNNDLHIHIQSKVQAYRYIYIYIIYCIYIYIYMYLYPCHR